MRPKLVVSADGRGVVTHAGSRLPADLADVTGLTGAFTDAPRRLRPRGTGHNPGADGVADVRCEAGQVGFDEFVAQPGEEPDGVVQGREAVGVRARSVSMLHIPPTLNVTHTNSLSGHTGL
ncbi:hypothetical protein ACQF36_28255 [Streptomyces sp. Marseille-Q5077]|uniref:hypothetical protein n=1 Tax=Streptomyces sp. Marseille-Q5077 TaxID=3418995 RepID=UPI003CFED094